MATAAIQARVSVLDHPGFWPSQCPWSSHLGSFVGNRSSTDSLRGDTVNAEDETVVDAEQGNGKKEIAVLQSQWNAAM